MKEGVRRSMVELSTYVESTCSRRMVEDFLSDDLDWAEGVMRARGLSGKKAEIKEERS